MVATFHRDPDIPWFATDSVSTGFILGTTNDNTSGIMTGN
ncbi:hypothetical protein XSR1_30144 [Xenorhabdus szentirmaii DSM 16338]|uniref:Uncharacterized protein n=1 Tax=Xenorhabdus szentirmaii DSM 16338 TaxID=1427518 RepID=W1J1E9_9GAMM|nr:hypothetical protein XSR1_30144 [Xenorhabdus szentirmaii DSM 16338]